MGEYLRDIDSQTVAKISEKFLVDIADPVDDPKGTGGLDIALRFPQSAEVMKIYIEGVDKKNKRLEVDNDIAINYVSEFWGNYKSCIITNVLRLSKIQEVTDLRDFITSHEDLASLFSKYIKDIRTEPEAASVSVSKPSGQDLALHKKPTFLCRRHRKRSFKKTHRNNFSNILKETDVEDFRLTELTAQKRNTLKSGQVMDGGDYNSSGP